jgi:hypothetical protein
VNVAFKAKNGMLLPGGAKRPNQTTDWSIELEWEELNKTYPKADEDYWPFLACRL